MTKTVVRFGLAIGLLAASACSGGDGDAGTSNAAGGPSAEAQGGEKTIGAGLDQDSRFFQAAKAAGLDATLAGPGPYTVLVPADDAFAGAPAGASQNWASPEGRAQLTGVLTYHILPGTILAEDIGKAIDNAKGQAVLATMGGATLTATRDGDRIVLADGSGNKATVTKADDRFSNGVVHHIDGVLSPASEQEPQAS